jgi:pimeloyl-ACP methyl ester carboxylesterase
MRPARLLPAFFCLLAAACVTPPPLEEPVRFEAEGGETVDAFHGTLTVPENRADPAAREITLHYIRFPATTDRPGAPIVYLAGGPGGSGIETAKGRRFPLFMAMRAFGDVIALDQRGTGADHDLPVCRSNQTPDPAVPLGDDGIAAAYRMALNDCLLFWEAEGIDIQGYTTAESVADLDDLRRHLGARQMSLWGISYGSHLALAAMDAMPGRLDRVVIASAEGLDQTVKLPARTDAYFGRLQAAVDRQPAARAAYPDIAGLMRRVHARLDEQPLRLTLQGQDVVVERWAMQQVAGSMIADPESAGFLLSLYASVDRGETGLLKAVLARVFDVDEPISLRPMPTAMDVASGISPARKALVEAQAGTSLLGAYLNFPMPQLDRAVPGLDLGQDFREGPVSDVPTLLLTGTLDGRTYPEGQLEAVAGLSDVRQIVVENAGHNLFMASPEVTAAIEAFMRGEALPDRIVVETPAFAQER